MITSDNSLLVSYTLLLATKFIETLSEPLLLFLGLDSWMLSSGASLFYFMVAKSNYFYLLYNEVWPRYLFGIMTP